MIALPLHSVTLIARSALVMKPPLCSTPPLVASMTGFSSRFIALSAQPTVRLNRDWDEIVAPRAGVVVPPSFMLVAVCRGRARRTRRRASALLGGRVDQGDVGYDDAVLQNKQNVAARARAKGRCVRSRPAERAQTGLDAALLLNLKQVIGGVARMSLHRAVRALCCGWRRCAHYAPAQTVVQ